MYPIDLVSLDKTLVSPPLWTTCTCHCQSHQYHGEEVLQQFQMSREENQESQRLKDIEEKLAAIQNEKNKEAEIPVSYLVSTSGRVF